MISNYSKAKLSILLLMLGTIASGGAGGSTLRPVSTYSIVARDPATGQLGVAVQSHWFSVGSLVTWAQAGVGAPTTRAT